MHNTHIDYPTSEDIRYSDSHPIRSLLQYSNILAIGSERDRGQVVCKMNEEAHRVDHFVHVPEIWALNINSYTMITCAPFKLDDLCGEYIRRQSEDFYERSQDSSSRSSRIIVKYTGLNGTLRDLECRAWFVSDPPRICWNMPDAIPEPPTSYISNRRSQRGYQSSTEQSSFGIQNCRSQIPPSRQGKVE